MVSLFVEGFLTVARGLAAAGHHTPSGFEGSDTFCPVFMPVSVCTLATHN
jgi:hypothetical protein